MEAFRRSKLHRTIAILVLIACVGTILLSSLKGNHIHFSMYLKAAHLIAQGENPYGRVILPDTIPYTWFLYSPLAAFTYFPLTFLPFSLALFCYLMVSLILVVWGSLKFLKVLEIPWDAKGLGLFYLMILSEVIGGLQTEKLEVAMSGIILLATAFFLSKRYKTSAWLLSLPTVWKLQPLALAGLFVLVLIKENKDRNLGLIRFCLSYLVGIIFFLALPLLWLPDSSFLKPLMATWINSIQIAVTDTWGSNYSSFNLLNHYIDFPKNARELKILGTGISLLFAITILFAKLTFQDRTLRALSLGIIYGTIFSPLAQPTSYAYGVPVIWVMGVMAFRKEINLWLPCFHWIFTSLVFSDLVPKKVRLFSFSAYFKPIGFTVLAAFLVFKTWFSSPEIHSKK